jgi:hypothetical protein
LWHREHAAVCLHYRLKSSPPRRNNIAAMQPTQKRPLSLIIISWLFIVLGLVSFIYGFLPQAQTAPHAGDSHFFDTWLVPVIRALASVSGIFILCGFNWARWLLVAWMAFHIAISLLHSLGAFLMHCVIFGAIGWFLFRPQASAFFKGREAKPL